LDNILDNIEEIKKEDSSLANAGFSFFKEI
jgi:hypothetical protein